MNERGDIIQITDEEHAWFPALLIVDEAKNWGVQAYAIIPQSNDGTKKPNTMFTRLLTGQYEGVGIAQAVAV
jgi:hypothetical protein